MLIPCFGNTDFKIVVKFNDTYLTDHVLSLSGAGFKALDKNEGKVEVFDMEEQKMTSDACLQDVLASLNEKIQRREVLYMNEYSKAFHGLAFDKVAFHASFCSRRCGRTSRQNLALLLSDRKAIL